MLIFELWPNFFVCLHYRFRNIAVLRAVFKSPFLLLGKSEVLHFCPSLETAVHVLRSNFKTCFNFSTFDTFESNFILAGFEKSMGLKS